MQFSKHKLAYDIDCGPCVRFKIAVDFFDRYHRIDFLSLIEADKFGLLNCVPQNLKFKSFHLISPDGDVKSGAEALLDLIELFPLGHSISKLIILIPGGKRMINLVYSLFSRLHESASCNINKKYHKTE